MRDSKSRYYSDLELDGTFEKIAAGEFFECALISINHAGMI